MSNKDFLLRECENVSKVLRETLRFKYGLEGSKDFYEECELRLNFIKKEINDTDEPDFERLDANFLLLEDLSKLISRIERSSRGEYSWPFVEELKEIASAICTEDTLKSNNNLPKVHVLSEGGLGAYQIFTEQKRPTASNKRILTIVFPRTLKHYVLFHPILGHELGHAIWKSSKHQSELKDIVGKLIRSSGIFSDERSVVSWLYSKNAPRGLQDVLNHILRPHGITENNFFNWADWGAWVEEILCDLIGLLIFGPSFVAAHCKLLYGISPSGLSFGKQHPLVACRVNMVLSAAEILGFDDLSEFPCGDIKNATEKFWGDLRSNVKGDDWFNIFGKGPLEIAVNKIGTLLSENPPSDYTRPDHEGLNQLYTQLYKLVPPVGFAMDEEKKPKCRPVDFRHILYAGWIVENSGLAISFYDINRLCEHGIMQQRGIDLFLKAKN